MVVITNGGMKLEIPYESFKQDYEPFGWKIIEDKRIPKEEKVIAEDKRIDKNEQKKKEATETIVENKKEDKEIKKKK